jgi:hypothetical protein
MHIVNEDGSPATVEQQIEYARALERAYFASRLFDFTGKLWAILAAVWGWFQGMLKPFLSAVCGGLVVAFLAGHLVLPTGGCNGPTPTPTPPPPAPSPLVKALQAAYDGEADPQRNQHLALLAANLGNTVALGKASGQLKTAQDLDLYVKGSATAVIGADALPVVRKAVGAYLTTKLPTDPTTPLTDALWATASTEYGNVAAALEQVKTKGGH